MEKGESSGDLARGEACQHTSRHAGSVKGKGKGKIKVKVKVPIENGEWLHAVHVVASDFEF
ncbi:hypothetical protein MO973_39170 [Paenibacillus sp. TRM 82003]|nr:hypothetical protein [Paenibacillus sp. TRM 82003]